MMRCKQCRSTWSVHPREGYHCACGGELENFDLDVHAAKLPHATPEEVDARFGLRVVEEKKKNGA